MTDGKQFTVDRVISRELLEAAVDREDFEQWIEKDLWHTASAALAEVLGDEKPHRVQVFREKFRGSDDPLDAYQYSRIHHRLRCFIDPPGRVVVEESTTGRRQYRYIREIRPFGEG